jgi:hypothetical protein
VLWLIPSPRIIAVCLSEEQVRDELYGFLYYWAGAVVVFVVFLLVALVTSPAQTGFGPLWALPGTSLDVLSHPSRSLIVRGFDGATSTLPSTVDSWSELRTIFVYEAMSEYNPSLCSNPRLFALRPFAS